MTTNDVVSTLSQLYRAEFSCPTARLTQAMPYISRRETAEGRTLRAVAQEDQEHLGWLVDLILARGGSPPPAKYPLFSTETHYVNLDSLLPTLIRSERDLLATYAAAGPALSADPQAARAVAQIIQRHTNHLATFESLKPRT